MRVVVVERPAPADLERDDVDLRRTSRARAGRAGRGRTRRPAERGERQQGARGTARRSSLASPRGPRLLAHRQHGVAIRSRTGDALAIPALRRPAEPCFSSHDWLGISQQCVVAAGGGLMLAVYVDTVPAATRRRARGACATRASTVRDAVALTPARGASRPRGERRRAARRRQPDHGGRLRGAARARGSSRRSPSASTTSISTPRAAHGVWVANVPDAVTEEVARPRARDGALARAPPAVPRSARRAPAAGTAFATGPRRRPSTLTLGIVGLGRTGRRLAELARTDLRAGRRSDPRRRAAGPRASSALPLDSCCGRADVLSLHVPAVARRAAAARRRRRSRGAPGAYPRQRRARSARRHRRAARRPRRRAGSRAPALDVVAGEPPPPMRRSAAILAWS